MGFRIQTESYTICSFICSAFTTQGEKLLTTLIYMPKTPYASRGIVVSRSIGKHIHCTQLHLILFVISIFYQLRHPKIILGSNMNFFIVILTRKACQMIHLVFQTIKLAFSYIGKSRVRLQYQTVGNDSNSFFVHLPSYVIFSTRLYVSL